MKNFAKKLLLIFFSAFLGLAICEIGLLLFGFKYSIGMRFWRRTSLFFAQFSISQIASVD
jgi:hypothetical protein